MRIRFYSASAVRSEDGFLTQKEFAVLSAKRQSVLEWWSSRATNEEKRDYGRVSDSAVRSLETSREMMTHSGYRCLWLEDESGELLCFADWFFGSMPSMLDDEEFYEGGESFFEGFNANGLSFGAVAYLYYVVTQKAAQGQGYARRLIAEMLQRSAAEGAEATVSDLPLKPYCQRIIDICSDFGFQPTPRIVEDENGNEWRQYAVALGERRLLITEEYAVGVSD